MDYKNDLFVERVYEYTLTLFNPTKKQLFIFQIKYNCMISKKKNTHIIFPRFSIFYFEGPKILQKEVDLNKLLNVSILKNG